MAGSYRHCVGEDGQFTFDLIDDMGDAHEACEMMVFMIAYLAGDDTEIIEEAENAFYEKLRDEQAA